MRRVIKKDDTRLGAGGTKADPIADEGNEVQDQGGYQYPIAVEWTREDVEEVLSTVGITVGYNTAVSSLHTPVVALFASDN